MSDSTTIAENRRARHDYIVEETLEAGLALVGSEVKSLRDRQASLAEAYCMIKDGQAYVVGMQIAQYKQASLDIPDPVRRRKLLFHRQELKKLFGKTQRRGYTLIPLKLYFNDRGIAKMLVGVCRGKQTVDKRETLKRRTIEREMRRSG
ncbi:SsrA-binding protein SmpB [bacterium]|nr:SsrA-binding protein SmpB [bacterium]